MPSVSAVIPAFNEETRVGEVVRRALAHVDEVVVVDDGSADGTSRVAAAAGARVVRLEPNQGYIAAVKRGFRDAAGEILVVLDADGQFDAVEIPRLVAPILDGRADMVQGRRTAYIRPSERFLTRLAALVGPVGDSGTGFRAGRASLLRSLRLRGRCICGVFALEALRMGARIAEVPVSLRPSPKPSNIAWYHLPQTFHVLREMVLLLTSSPTRPSN